MSIMLERAELYDCEKLWKMQVEAFSELLEKYRDYETSPANEPVSRVEERLKQPFTYYYFIMDGKNVEGAIRVVDMKDGSRKRISPVFIMKEFRGKRYAQKAIIAVEQLHGSDNWALGYHFAGGRELLSLRKNGISSDR